MKHVPIVIFALVSVSTIKNKGMKKRSFKLCKKKEIVLLCIIIEASLNQAFVNENE
jgi:hypothetical protein